MMVAKTEHIGAKKGGVLDMNSEVGKGTEFIIKIPMRHGSGR